MSTLIETALAREAAAWRVYKAAHEEANNASAEWARLQLIALSEDEQLEPAVVGLRFTTEYCYDDEGGYFDSLSVALLDAEGDDIDYDSDFEGVGTDAIRRLCGVPDGADEGSITVAEARERSF